jgi:hypothetical protein
VNARAANNGYMGDHFDLQVGNTHTCTGPNRMEHSGTASADTKTVAGAGPHHYKHPSSTGRSGQDTATTGRRDDTNPTMSTTPPKLIHAARFSQHTTDRAWVLVLVLWVAVLDFHHDWGLRELMQGHGRWQRELQRHRPLRFHHWQRSDPGNPQPT